MYMMPIGERKKKKKKKKKKEGKKKKKNELTFPIRRFWMFFSDVFSRISDHTKSQKITEMVQKVACWSSINLTIT